jgi:hypothetical protein
MTPKGFTNLKDGCLKNEDVDFYAQGVFAKDEMAERMDKYAKPGTTAKSRESDMMGTTMPTSRYRSRRP